ncbi:MAG TPA: FHA domain-containing protein [Ktedonobacterales bacterium]
MAYLDIETPEGTHRIALERERLCIGRLATNDVVLAFPQVSRQHAELRFVGGQWWIADLHSTNGLQIDARRVQDHALRDGDRIVLAPGILLRFIASGANPHESRRRPSGALWEDAHPRQPSAPRSSPLSRPQPGAPVAPVLPPAAQAPASRSAPNVPAIAARSAAGSFPAPGGAASFSTPASGPVGFDDPAPFALWSATPPAGPTHAPVPTVPIDPSESDAYASVANGARSHGGYPVPHGPLHSGAPVGGDDPFRRDAPAGEAGRATAGPATLLHVCQTCGQRTDPSAIYCQHCHNSIASECANCRLSLLPIQDRCPRCHTPNLHSVRRARARPTSM